MAEVKWQARRVSDSVLVDVTADVDGTVLPAPNPNAIEGGGAVTPPVEFDAGGEFDENVLSVTGSSGVNQLRASGEFSRNSLSAEGASGYNELLADFGNNTLYVGGPAGYNILEANNAAGIPLRIKRAAAQVNVLVGTADPSAGGGVASALLGSLYIRTTTPQLWIKTSAPDTGWTRIATV